MRLEDYFDVLAENDIRISGTRVGIETVLYDFIHRCQAPETIAQTYPTITLEQVYATITYYLHNQAAIDQYLTEWLEHGERLWAAQQRNPTAAMLRIRQLRAERQVTRTGTHQEQRHEPTSISA